MPDAPQLYPLTFEPELHEKVWGGRRLERVLGKSLPPEEPIGESWELHGGSVVATGAYKRCKLDDLAAELGAPLLGEALCDLPNGRFPLLFKYIDANEWLSVQVHPDDAYAQAHTGDPYGKTEAWYILHAEPGAQLVHGWKRQTSAGEVEAAVRDQRLEELLEYVEVVAGDVVYVPAGTVHAIGGGIVLAEIQQSSDTTYRLYDWGRVGLDGKPRDLHLRESLETLDYTVTAEHKQERMDLDLGGVTLGALVESEHFELQILEGNAPLETWSNPDRCDVISMLRGSVQLEWDGGQQTLQRGQTALIPAGLGQWSITPEGEFQMLRMYVPVEEGEDESDGDEAPWGEREDVLRILGE